MDTRFSASDIANLKKGNNKMNAVPKNLYLHIAVVAVLSGGAASANAADFKAADFAEELYHDFSEFSDGKIVFDVTASKLESLAAADNLTIASFLPVGSHVVNFHQGIIDVDDIRIEEGASNPLLMEMRQQKMTDFEDGRLSMSSGTFRILSVKAIIGKEIRQSQAVEFCWPAQGYCYVEDNSIPNLWGVVKMIRQARASGYKETITYSSPQGKFGAGYVCNVRGSNSSSVTVSVPALNSNVFSGSREIGTYHMPAGAATMGCEIVRDGFFSHKCEARIFSNSLPTPHSSASRGYESKCSVSAADIATCGPRGFFEREHGCAWGRVRTNWSFGFSVPPLSCNAEVTPVSENTVATRVRALSRDFVCDATLLLPGL